MKDFAAGNYFSIDVIVVALPFIFILMLLVLFITSWFNPVVPYEYEKPVETRAAKRNAKEKASVEETSSKDD